MPMRVLDNHTVMVPAGEYWLGDPSYAFADGGAEWQQIIDTTNIFSDPVGRVGDHEVLLFGTHNGDGTYESDLGKIDVDRGLVGLVPVAAAVEHKPFGMYRVLFMEETRCWSEDGKLNFGSHLVDTHPDPEEDEPESSDDDGDIDDD